MSESTVRTQVKSILAKLQVSSQLTAVGLAHELGWESPTTHGHGDARRRAQASSHLRAG